MGIKGYGQKPFIMAAPIAFIIFSIGTLISIINSPTWELNNLSALGGSKDALTAVAFGASCVSAGLLIAFFGVGKIIFERRLDKAAGAFFVLGGLGLMMVGIFDSSYHLDLHNIWTISFAAAMVIAVGLTSLSDILRGNILVFVYCIAMVAIIVVQWPVFSGAMSECIAIGLASVWSFIQTAKYQDLGMLDGSPATSDSIRDY
ncbi:MAG: hypothetical protein II855_03705 [Candidatus Methanomethylophilaceae archaeon]|nr:hypothetical protein [Candidatus Methanomethylophilaceae archaeon]